MLIDTLKKLYTRDLNRLHQEIAMYEDEHKLWYVEDGISNTAGNLCLHLIGNLNTYIGAALGKSGYIRNRPAEFSVKDIPRKALLEQIEETQLMVIQTLESLTEAQLAAEYPILVFAEKTSTEYLLVHLTTHLTYHLGQINYHRRLLDK